MATQQARKILRIGVIQNGTIIEERLFRKAHPITIGKHHRNTFSIFAPVMPSTHTLFEVKGGKYHLVFDATMTGRISVAGAVFTIDGLRGEKRAVRRGNHWSIPLDLRSRGKLVIGDIIFLFQGIVIFALLAARPIRRTIAARMSRKA